MGLVSIAIADVSKDGFCQYSTHRCSVCACVCAVHRGTSGLQIRALSGSAAVYGFKCWVVVASSCGTPPMLLRAPVAQLEEQVVCVFVCRDVTKE